MTLKKTDFMKKIVLAIIGMGLMVSCGSKNEVPDRDVLVDSIETMEQNLKKFIADAKKTYKECEAANSWPAKLGGYSLSREKTQDKIIDAAQKLADIQLKTGSKKNQLVALEKTLKITQNEQKRIVTIREQVQNTINDLRIKKVIDGDNSIVASLNAIEDNMGTLGVNYDDPKIESIIQPDEKATREELFKQIMAE
jgi:hypothetical protein